MKPAVVYISYDGMLEPLGQSQVLAYLERLSSDYAIHLISFEKKADRADAARMADMRRRTATGGIVWTPLAYHKWPSAPATTFDIVVGTLVALWLVLRHRVNIVHVRSYVPAAMGLVVTRLTGAKFLFDIRGFWADERVDGGIWRADSALYRVTKWLERRFFRAADQIVTLTQASKREIAGFKYLEGRTPAIAVIPTCADLELFKPQPATKPEVFTLGYVGSVGSWYLFDEVVACFRILLEHEPGAKLLIVNRNEHELIRESLRRGGVDAARAEIIGADHREMPTLIGRMSAGSAIYKPAYSKIATAPTKLGEYLGCGVPCLGNNRVGDMEQILEGNRVGVALTDFSDQDRRKAVARLIDLVRDPQTTKRCVETAHALFSLQRGVDLYREAHIRLSEGRRGPASAPARPAQEPQ
jgi:glycosyltransferase involved in cell wall biosynthesis